MEIEAFVCRFVTECNFIIAGIGIKQSFYYDDNVKSRQLTCSTF